MDLVLYLVLLLTPLPLVYLIQKHRHHVFCLPPFLALVGIYIFNVIGSIKVIRNDHLFSEGYYFSVLFVLLLFYVFYFFLFLLRNKITIDWRSASLRYNETNYLFLFPLWGYCLWILFLYYSRHGLPPLFDLNINEYTDIYGLREEKWTDLPEGSHWYVLGFITIPSFIVVYTYVLKSIIKTKTTAVVFYLNLLAGLFFLSLTLTKTPLVYLMVYILLADFLIRGRDFSFRRIVAYVLLFLVAITFLIRIYLLDRGIFDVVLLVPGFLFERIFAVYVEAHAYILKIFPGEHAYFYGRAFGNPAGLLPFDPVNLSQFLGYRVQGDLQNYSMPSYSHGYANFGLLGIVIVICLMFAQILVIQIVFRRCSHNPLFLTFYIIISERMMHYAHQPIDDVVSGVFLVFALLVIPLYYMTKRLKVVAAYKY